MKITFFRHVGFLSGTGVGGGSLVYANTLPVPKQSFFTSGSWTGLADWQSELNPFYETSLHMLGASENPELFDSDHALQQLAVEIGRQEKFEPTRVSVHFGEPGVPVPDPYFGGKGPERSGCIFCGSCMTGCRHNAKNTLDKNYLYLAQQHGAAILSEHEVIDVVPLNSKDGSGGYELWYKPSTRIIGRKKKLRTGGIVFSGGVLGTVKLLLKLKRSSLPGLSNRVGEDIRTNNENLIVITSFNEKKNLSNGVAIGSILHADENTHIELCRYGRGSGAWRWALVPLPEGNTALSRFLYMFKDVLMNPRDYLKYVLVRDWAKSSVVLLFMQTLDTTLKFSFLAIALIVSLLRPYEMKD